MERLPKQALMYAENLSFPSFQVIVVNTNLGCDDCRRRVSQVVSKMAGLREYTVDVRNKLVILKGDTLDLLAIQGTHAPTRRKERLKNQRLIPSKFKFSISSLMPTGITTCFLFSR